MDAKRMDESAEGRATAVVSQSGNGIGQVRQDAGQIDLAIKRDVSPDPPERSVIPTESEILAQLQWQRNTLWNEIINIEKEIQSRYPECGCKRLTVASDKCAKHGKSIIEI